MFRSDFGEGDNEIIAYLEAGYKLGKEIIIYGYSHGGAAAVRIANTLGAMHITVLEINLYDPVSLGGEFVFKFPNVMKVNNYYQRNSIDGVFWWADNPFKGSSVSGKFQFPAINNVDLTGKYYSPGVLVNHINIVNHVKNR